MDMGSTDVISHCSAADISLCLISENVYCYKENISFLDGFQSGNQTTNPIEHPINPT